MKKCVVVVCRDNVSCSTSGLYLQPVRVAGYVMRWGVIDSTSERFSEVTIVCSWYGILGVLIKVEGWDREISIRGFRNI